MGKSKSGEHYVDNVEFYKAIVAWKKKNKGRKETGDGVPPVTDYIGRCFLKIAERLSLRGDFFSRSELRDEMIGDAVLNCVSAADNFDPVRFKNPFAYFTQVVYYSFIRTINSEKKQTEAKYRSLQSMELDNRLPKWVKDEIFKNDAKSKFVNTLRLSETDIERMEADKLMNREREKKQRENLSKLLED